MTTDNFLTTKSVLGLAERVVNCPPLPPEILDLNKYANQTNYVDNPNGQMIGTFTLTDDDYALLNKLPSYAAIYSRLKENQIDNVNGSSTVNCWIPLFHWANVNYGQAITTTGIVGVIYILNKNATIYQYKLSFYDGVEVTPII